MYNVGMVIHNNIVVTSTLFRCFVKIPSLHILTFLKLFTCKMVGE